MERIKTKFANLQNTFYANKQSYVYLGLILLNQFAYGMSSKILYPIETDLGYIYDVPPLTIDNFFVPIYTAFLLGSLANYLHVWLNRQLMLVFFILLTAVAYSLIPHYGHLWIAHFAMALNGIGSGVWECGSSIWLIEIMPNKMSVVLQASQFVYNLGSTLAPQLTKPFAWGDALVDDKNQTLTVADRQKALAIPFLIFGYIQAIVPIIFLALYCMNPYESTHPHSKRSYKLEQAETVVDSPVVHRQSIGDNDNKSRDGHHHNLKAISYRPYKMILCGFTIATYYTAEIAYLNFSSQLFKEIGLTDSEVNQAYTDLTIMNLVGPLVTTVISFKLQPQNVILYHYVIVIAAFLLLYFGHRNQTLVLISNAFLGLGLSPMLPAILAFTEINLQLNERDISVYTFLCGVVLLVTPFIKRAAFKISPYILFGYEAVFIPISLVLFLTAKWWIFHPKRFGK